MAIHELKEQIARLPEQPGVYLYFNADGDTIYVGKARALRDRVRNYLGGYGSDVKRDALLDEIARLEGDRKSTPLNSRHQPISYAVFFLKKKKNKQVPQTSRDHTR